MEKRRIAVIIGSDNDLPQCSKGLQFLKFHDGDITIADVHTMSIHRNGKELLNWLKCNVNKIDVIIAGAGWAAHLPGVIDSYLRYTLCDTHVVVIGVAFEDTSSDSLHDCEQHNLAAKLSISEVPGTQVVWRDEKGQYIGESGFFRACQSAVLNELPSIKMPKKQRFQHRTVQKTLDIITKRWGKL